MKHRNGFSLAEVLVTLSIIGVVAAIVLPVIISSTHNLEYTVGLNKAYGTVFNAVRMLETEYNCIGNLESSGIFTNDSSHTWDIFKIKLSIIKDCGVTDQGCWSDKTSYLDDSNSRNLNTSGFATGILADGMSIAIDAYDCNKAIGDYSKVCSTVYMDVNGLKKPNKFGRDVFIFHIINNIVYPDGKLESQDTCTIPGNGYGCAERVLREGGINY